MKYPSYLNLLESGELDARVAKLKAFFARCEVCPRGCHIDRTHGETGICRSTDSMRVSSYGPHHGEEDPIRGWNGSGTIFLSSCNLRCHFCQNFEISQIERGKECTPAVVSSIMLALQSAGCHNINWVTPTHFAPSLIEALGIAARDGLHIPIVYNSSAYDSIEVIRLLDGLIDIYMPDFKFWDPEKGKTYLSAPDYPEVARNVIREMHRQVGDLFLSADGIAERGLLVRHLVMPGALEDTRHIVEFIAHEISPQTYVNLMAQYYPQGQAAEYPEINRFVTVGEYKESVKTAQDAGLSRIDRRITLAKFDN